jgi:hypothetical protein
VGFQRLPILFIHQTPAFFIVFAVAHVFSTLQSKPYYTYTNLSWGQHCKCQIQTCFFFTKNGDRITLLELIQLLEIYSEDMRVYIMTD